MITLRLGGKTYPCPNVSTELLRVAKLWKKNAQAKLRRAKINASGDLKSSMKLTLHQDRDDIWVDLTPDVDYWEFVDLGVRGAGPLTKNDKDKGYPFKGQQESPFKYTKKRPPLKPLMDWIKVKPVTPRDKDGKFMKHRAFAFLLQAAIFRRGLKPSFFISGTGDRIQRKYAQSIADAYAKDMANAMLDNLS